MRKMCSTSTFESSMSFLGLLRLREERLLTVEGGSRSDEYMTDKTFPTLILMI